jgi:hypothetical protein
VVESARSHGAFDLSAFETMLDSKLGQFNARLQKHIDRVVDKRVREALGQDPVEYRTNSIDEDGSDRALNREGSVEDMVTVISKSASGSRKGPMEGPPLNLVNRGPSSSPSRTTNSRSLSPNTELRTHTARQPAASNRTNDTLLQGALQDRMKAGVGVDLDSYLDFEDDEPVRKSLAFGSPKTIPK